MVPWNAARSKVQLRQCCPSLSVQRLRTLQEKKVSIAKQSRREIATLIEKGKLETARIKVENIINEDIQVELLELLELYCELLIARFGLLELHTREPDPGVEESVCAIIHASPRTEVKELHVLREMLMQKYGREFSVRAMDNKDGCVSDRVVKKLVMATPSKQLVNAYLHEIAKGYKIEWAADSEDVGEGGDGGLVETLPSGETEALQRAGKAIADATKGTQLPDPPPVEESTSAGGKAQGADEDEFTLLRRRFEALKSRK